MTEPLTVTPESAPVQEPPAPAQEPAAPGRARRHRAVPADPRPPGAAARPTAPPETHLTEWAGPRATKLGSGPFRVHTSAEEHPVIIFFEALLVLVCVGVLAFAGLTVKKLYQGQR